MMESRAPMTKVVDVSGVADVLQTFTAGRTQLLAAGCKVRKGHVVSPAAGCKVTREAQRWLMSRGQLWCGGATVLGGQLQAGAALVWLSYGSGRTTTGRGVLCVEHTTPHECT